MPDIAGTTLNALVARIRRMLEDSALLDALTASVSSSAASLTVATPRLYGKDMRLEVADETILTTADVSGFSIAVTRGYEDTTAAAYNSGQVVRIAPRYPQANIKEAINIVLGNWISFYCPQLVWDSSTAGNFSTDRDIYPLPANATNVVRVTWKESGRVNLIDVDHGPLEPWPTTVASTGYGVRVYTQGLPGRTVQVLYERPWPALASGTDTIAADFPDMLDNLIVDGAVLYLLGYRMSPKYRMDEGIFAREQGEALPANFSVQSLEIMRRNWISGMHRMTTMRAQPTKPRLVFRDERG